MDTKNAKELIEKYQAGMATPEEVALIEKWVTLGSVKALDLSEDELAVDFSMIRTKLPLKYEAKRVQLWPRIVTVAAAVALIVLGVYFFSAPRNSDTETNLAQQAAVNDIAPGKNGATITLANGQVIQLSDAKNGVVIGANKLAYDDNTLVSSVSGELLKNAEELTASTTKGQTYQFTLPDGSHVWLNADSKISFSSQFIGKTRKILLEGEAYFEVAKDKNKPFIVAVNNQQIKVLGTHFNVSGYKDQVWTVTTLLEGSVQVDTKLDSKTLKPGQQSVGDVRGLSVKEVDPTEAIDWKNGLFVFANEPLESIMQKISRWYNVDVSYANADLGKETFSGTISRFSNISKVLERLERTGVVKFGLKGKEIIVK